MAARTANLRVQRRLRHTWLIPAAAAACWTLHLCWLAPFPQEPPQRSSAAEDLMHRGRRSAMVALGAGIALSTAEDALAFKNAADIRPGAKITGPQPTELGVLDRGFDSKGDEVVGLKQCRDAPNCFSTTFESFDQGRNNIDAWKFSGKSGSEAIAELKAAVKAYQPGQQGIDKGGFEVIDSKDNYLYVQFQSQKGYIDDVEFALSPTASNGVLVRSASRLGFYDVGVNYLRLEAIAETVKQKGGWTINLPNGKSHPFYFKDGNCAVAEVRSSKLASFCS